MDCLLEKYLGIAIDAVFALAADWFLLLLCFWLPIQDRLQLMMKTMASIGAIRAIVSLLRFFLVVFVIGGACLIFVT